MKKSFTLVEILIVVAILGILAAIVLPTFQDHITEAKEAAAKDNLRILRNAIEIYAAQHNNVPPGYINGDTEGDPTYTVYWLQMMDASNAAGQTAAVGTPGYEYGPYLSEYPENPFNGFSFVAMVPNGESFPAEPTGEYGWVYQPRTKTIKLDWPGADTKGIRYYDY